MNLHNMFNNNSACLLYYVVSSAVPWDFIVIIICQKSALDATPLPNNTIAAIFEEIFYFYFF